MIQHVSVTADDPRSAAETVATLLGGRAIPVGPTEGTWTAFGPDALGNMIEVLPRGSEFHRKGDHLETRKGDAVRHSGFHVMIETPLSEEEVLALGNGSAVRCTHGPFDLIEFWIDDCLLLEVLPPPLSEAYRHLFNSGELRKRYSERIA